MLNDYDKIIKENFDLFDAPTRRMIVSLEDAGQTQLLSALSNALYNKIVSNIDKIDFGSIPRSRGDITRVEKFEDTEECLIIMKKLVEQYKQNTDIVDTVIEAVQNVKSRKALFTKGFAMGNSFVMSLYNLIVLAIEQSVSFLISVCIQYIKDPDTKSLRIALDKVSYYNTKDNVVYEQLVAFNESCANGNMDKILDAAMKNKISVSKEAYEDIAIVAKVDGEPDREVDIPQNPKPEGEVLPNPKDIPDPDVDVVQEEEPEEDYGDEIGVGSNDPIANDGVVSNDIAINDKTQAATEAGMGLAVVASIALLPALIKIIVSIFRHLAYFFNFAGMKFADTLEVQGNLIELNAYTLQTSEYLDDGIEDKKRAEIVKKQLNVANTLKKWSNKIAMIFTKSDKKTRDAVEKDNNTKYTADSMKDDLPADIYNRSVLF